MQILQAGLTRVVLLDSVLGMMKNTSCVGLFTVSNKHGLSHSLTALLTAKRLAEAGLICGAWSH